MRCFLAMCVLGAVTALPSLAQDETKRDRIAGEVDISFANTSTVRMILLTETIDVHTPYGKLTIPLKEIKQIEFGVHYAEGLERQIEEAVKKLGSDVFRDREAASTELIRLGADAYPAVHQAASFSTDLEKKRRAVAVLQVLKANVPSKEQRLQHNDQIVLPTFTLVGRIVTPTIKAKAEIFGDVQLPLTQLRSLRSTETPSEIAIGVDAGKYAAMGGNEWMPTDFQIDAKTRISISATGTIDLWPQNGGGGDFIATPRGLANGNGGPGNRGRTPPGVLVGKIGENGPSFVIGESYEGIPGRDGKLFLQIGASPWSNAPSGNYQVKIGVKY